MTTGKVSDPNETPPNGDHLLPAFQRIGTALLSSLDLDEVLDILATEIISAGVFRSLMIATVEENPREIVVVRSLYRLPGRTTVPGAPYIDRERLKMRFEWESTNIIAEVARTGVMAVVEGWDDRFDPRTRNEPYDDRVSYFVPVSNEQGTLAVVATGSTAAEKGDTLRRIEAMQPLLNQVAVAIQHARVHKRLQAEIADRKASEERYRSLFENMQSGFALHEIIGGEEGAPADYVILDLNDAFLSIIGLPRSQVIGKRASEIDSPNIVISDRWMRECAIVAETGESFFAEYYSDSQEKYFAVNAYGVKPGQFAAIVTDISDRKRLDEEKRKSRNLQSLGVLAGGIAHDFNNMLTGVMGGLSLLRSGFSEGSSEYEIASLAEASAKKSRELTQQLITFAKGGRPIKKPLDLRHLIVEVVSAAAGATSATPFYKLPDVETMAKVDRHQITQVIDNIARNGIEAMPDGGELTVELQSVQIDSEKSLPLDPGRYLKLSFSDRGIGIPDETMTKIFDPYFSTKPMAQGLGLAISYSIVQRHNGTISARSKVGHGSTFEVYLPARTD